MDETETGSLSIPNAATASEAPVEPPQTHKRPAWRQSPIVRGIKAGFWIGTFLGVPLTYVFALIGAVLTMIGLGAGRGFAVTSILVRSPGIWLSLAACGSMLGGFLGLIGWLTSRGLRAVLGRVQLIPGRFLKRAEVAPIASRRRRIWPWVVAVGFTGLVLLGAFSFGVYLGGHVDRRLANAVQAADEDDPNWRLHDLIEHREEIPDDENSAFVATDVLDRLPEGWPHPSPTLMEVLERVAASPRNVRLEGSTAELIHQELKKFDAAVQSARMLVEYTRGRHEIELGPTLIDTPLRETQEVRTVVRLLASDAVIRADQGDIDGALDSCRAIIAAGRSIGDEPFVISQLVRTAAAEVAVDRALRALGMGEASDEAMERLQSLLLKEKSSPVLVYGLRGERAVNFEIIKRLGAGELPITALSSPGAASLPAAIPSLIGPCAKLWYDHQLAVGLEWMNQAVSIARLPVHEQPARWKEWDDELQRVRKSRIGIYGSTLPLLLMAGLSASSNANERRDAALGSMVVLIAAERQRRKTGSCPASVEAVDRELLPAPPLDPWTGRPFLFRRVPGGLIVHSLGPNLKDEGGDYDPKQWSRHLKDDVGATGWDVALRNRPFAVAE